MRVALDQGDERFITAIKHAWRTTGTRKDFDGDKLVSEMETAELQGRVDRVAFGSKLSALDSALGDLRVERFTSLGVYRFNIRSSVRKTGPWGPGHP